jgi:anti-anti-sigma regulatory factor
MLGPTTLVEPSPAVSRPPRALGVGRYLPASDDVDPGAGVTHRPGSTGLVSEGRIGLKTPAAPGRLLVHQHLIETTTVLRLVGDLNAAGAAQLHAVLHSGGADRRHLIVDLRAVRQVDRTGVAALNRAHHDIAGSGGMLCLAAAPHQVGALLDPPRFDNVDRALNWLHGGRPHRGVALIVQHC